jgi:uncharacterized protein YqjF (DUF2071 family)
MASAQLDRIAPTRKPQSASPSGFQTWKNLLFAHWFIAPDEMRRVVPEELELDLWEGKALCGVVPFSMHDIRLAWMPEPLGMDFLETNLRTYVHYKGEPGVYFFSLEASSRLAVQAARWGWGLPYHYADMNYTARDGLVSYTSHRLSNRDANLLVDYAVGEPLGPSVPGSLEFFLLERYLLFSLKKGLVHKGQVHHEPYPVQAASVARLQCGLVAAAGLPAVTTLPDLLHYSPGVDVAVYGPWPMP